MFVFQCEKKNPHQTVSHQLQRASSALQPQGGCSESITAQRTRKLKYMVCQKGFSKSSFPKILNRNDLNVSFSFGEHANILMLTGTPRPGCRWTFSPGSFCSATVAAPPGDQTDRNINMLHDWTYWRRTRILTAVPTQYRSIPDSTTLCTAVLTEVTGPTYWICGEIPLSHYKQKTDIQRLSVAAASQATPPNTRRGRGFRFNLLWLVSAVLLSKMKHQLF